MGWLFIAELFLISDLSHVWVSTLCIRSFTFDECRPRSDAHQCCLPSSYNFQYFTTSYIRKWKSIAGRVEIHFRFIESDARDELPKPKPKWECSEEVANTELSRWARHYFYISWSHFMAYLHWWAAGKVMATPAVLYLDFCWVVGKLCWSKFILQWGSLYILICKRYITRWTSFFFHRTDPNVGKSEFSSQSLHDELVPSFVENLRLWLWNGPLLLDFGARGWVQSLQRLPKIF